MTLRAKMYTRSRMSQEERVTFLSTADALERLRTAKTHAVDYRGPSNSRYLEELLERAEPPLAFTVQSSDDPFIKRLADTYQVFVAPEPEEHDGQRLVLSQDGGFLFLEEDSQGEYHRWLADDPTLLNIVVRKMTYYAPYDGKSIASSVARLRPHKRRRLEKNLHNLDKATMNHVFLVTAFQVILWLMYGFISLSFALGISQILRGAPATEPFWVGAILLLPVLGAQLYVWRERRALWDIEP